MGTGLIVPRSNKRYGWVPQRGDIRDQRFTLRLESLPSKADTRPQDVADTILNQGDLGSCHDDETEILTEFGFKLFSQLNGSERLATVNPDTAELSFEVPVRLVRFHYTGPLYCVDNQSLNFRVTPDHQMLVRKWNGRDRTLDSTYSLVPMKDVGWYTGLLNRVIWRGEVAADTYTLPGVDHKHKPQRESRDVPMRAWMRFLGLYLAEGTMLKRDQCPGRVSYKIQIAATKEREKEFARAIFADLDITALELNDRFTFSNKQIYAAMESLGLLGIKAGQKFVPAFVFRQGAEMITEFLAGHFAGDGTEQYGIRAHYTSSVQLASDLQALIFLSGNETRMSVRAGRTSMTADGRAIAGSLPEHRISVCERKNLSLERKNTVFTEEYDGEVFCAEVPTFHTLVTRRQGKVLVSGNCTANSIAGMYRYEAHKQGLPDIHPARLQIYYDERAMEGTVDSDAGAMLRDGLKVVATNGVAPEELWPYDISKFTQKPPQDVYDAALKHQALKYQAIDQDLNAMKSCLAAGFQFVFGFTVYSSFESAQVAKTGQMPLPGTNESVLGGHAVRAVGYDDTLFGGVVIVANSWGLSFGASGYFFMPYAYITSTDLASDFWTIQIVE